MSAEDDSTSLKLEALRLLDEGRSELRAEFDRLGARLNPRKAVGRLVDHHTGGAMGAAFLGGLVLAFVGFGGHHAAGAPVLKAAPFRKGAAAAAGLLGIIARAGAGPLLKALLATPLRRLASRNPDSRP